MPACVTEEGLAILVNIETIRNNKLRDFALMFSSTKSSTISI